VRESEDRSEHGAGDAATLGGGRSGDDAEGKVSGARVDETDAEEFAGDGIERGDGCAGIERGVNVREEAEGFVTAAKAGALTEASLIPMDERTVEETGGGFVIGRGERAENEVGRHE